MVSRGADKRSIARSLARWRTKTIHKQQHHHQIRILRPPAWNFACVPRLCRGTVTLAANGTAALPPTESVSRCSISAAAQAEVGRSTGGIMYREAGKQARSLAR